MNWILPETHYILGTCENCAFRRHWTRSYEEFWNRKIMCAVQISSNLICLRIVDFPASAPPEISNNVHLSTGAWCITQQKYLHSAEIFGFLPLKRLVNDGRYGNLCFHISNGSEKRIVSTKTLSTCYLLTHWLWLDPEFFELRNCQRLKMCGFSIIPIHLELLRN